MAPWQMDVKAPKYPNWKGPGYKMATECDNRSRQGEMWRGCDFQWLLLLHFISPLSLSWLKGPSLLFWGPGHPPGRMFPTSGPHKLLGSVPPQYWESPLGVFILFVFSYLTARLPFMFVYSSSLFLSGLLAPSQNISSWRGGTQAVILTEAS